VTFAAAETEKSFAVPIVDDGVDEPAETFFVDLANLMSPVDTLLLDPRGTGTILDHPLCSRSPGFWKNHRQQWPAEWLRLGGVLYDDLDLMTFLEYGGPDASVKLARQLVATKLNLLAGSDPFILPVVGAADSFLELFPPGSDPRGEDRRSANEIKDELDAHNNLHCQDDREDDE